LDSAVYLDDNPVERDRVRKAFPEVEVPDLPSDFMLYKETLESLMYFNSTDVTEEDRKRTELYASQRLRIAEQQVHDSVEDWLMTLNTTVSCELLAEHNIARAVQLLNKTNQMNLTTRRMNEKELVAWSGTDDHRVWVFRVADKFSDLGITGIISLDITDDIANVADFILSCRVMGRKIEETMLSVLIGYAKIHDISKVTAMYYPTEKNKPCFEFWKKSGFDFAEETMSFSWDTRSSYMMPAQVSLIDNC
jgi:FkbH-like protein